MDDTRSALLGAGWSFSLGDALTPDADGSLVLRRGTGRVDRCARVSGVGAFFALSDTRDVLTQAAAGTYRPSCTTRAARAAHQFHRPDPQRAACGWRLFAAGARRRRGDLGGDRVSVQDGPPTAQWTIRKRRRSRCCGPPGSEVLHGGARFRIQWVSDDNVGVAGHDLALSTGQMSGTPIAAAVNGNAQSFDWILPPILRPAVPPWCALPPSIARATRSL